MNLRFLWISLIWSSLCAEITDEITVEMRVPALYRLSLSETAHDFAAATAADFAAGYTEESRALTATVKSNQPWQLTIQAEQESLGELESGTKPISDLLWKRSDQRKWRALATESCAVKSCALGSTNTQIPIDLRVVLNWNEDGPGTYETTLLFTLGTLP